jgi:hypothetical protein
MGSRDKTDVLKRKISCPCSKSNPDSSVVKPIAQSPTELFQLPHICYGNFEALIFDIFELI